MIGAGSHISRGDHLWYGLVDYSQQLHRRDLMRVQLRGYGILLIQRLQHLLLVLRCLVENLTGEPLYPVTCYEILLALLYW